MSFALVLALAGGCMQKRVASLEEQLEARDATIAQRDTTIGQLRDEKQGYVLELDTLRSELDSVRRRNADLAALYGSLIDEFAPEIQNGTASLVVFDDRSVVAFGDQVCFESGSATLTASGREAVRHLAEVLRSHPDRRFQVEGHTDALPIATARYPSNWELGAERAIAVVKELVADGVPADHLSAATYADTAPLATNTHPMGRAINRRMTVTLQTTLQETGAQQALYEAARKSGHLAFGDLTIVPNPVAENGR